MTLDISSLVCPESVLSSEAVAINNGGQIAGYCTSNQGDFTVQSGFIYNSTNEYTYSLPTYVVPSDINDSGWVVGIDTGSYSSPEYPFLFIDGIIYNLYDLISSTLNSIILSLLPSIIKVRSLQIATRDMEADTPHTPYY